VHNPAHAWREIGVWVGAPMMIADGLLSLAFQGRTMGRALRGLVTRRGSPAHAAVEVPATWFATGTLTATVGVLAIGHLYFGIPWHLGLLAVALTFFLSLVACRATGESDITPVGALGKVMQLVYGVLIPQNATANLMTASITSNAAVASADLLTDLKSGYLLGAHPRRQFVAQFLGIFAGTVATVLGYRLLVPDATVLTGTSGSPATFPAPAAQAWLAAARVFQGGLHNLHPMARTCLWWGLGAGVLLVVVEHALPKHRKWLPSPTGLGLGFILPFFNPFSMLLGALLAWGWSRRRPAHADRYLVPVASGVIAGESIISVAIALVNNLFLRH
jgi:OPT family oligopeptide transporter